MGGGIEKRNVLWGCLVVCGSADVQGRGVVTTVVHVYFSHALDLYPLIHARFLTHTLTHTHTQHPHTQHTQSLALLEIMWEGGEDVQPDVVTYNSVLKALGNAHQLDFAVRLFKVGVSCGLRGCLVECGCVGVLQHVYMYAPVCLCCQLGSLINTNSNMNTPSLSLVHTLSRLRPPPPPPLNPTPHTHPAHPPRTPTPTQDLCARGIDPSITTYGIMLAAAADAGDLGVLHDTWRTLVTSGLEVNSSCINTYITGLAKLVGRGFLLLGGGGFGCDVCDDVVMRCV